VKAPRARLALPGSPPLAGRARLIRQIEKWARGFEGKWPEETTRPVSHWHLPADQRLVDQPSADRDDQRKCASALLLAAEHLSRARPVHCADAQVYAAIFWPEMFMSEAGVFHDADYARDFDLRAGPYETWTPFDPASRSLARELGFAVPPGFTESGFAVVRTDDDVTYTGEIWLYRT
jgi:hypothetical protein